MRKIFTTISIAAALLAATSCLQEVFPSSGVIADQIEGDASAVEAQVNSIPGAMFRFGSAYTSCGYPGLMILRDAMLADVPVYDLTYDYYGWYVGTSTSYLGDYDLESDNWLFYVKLIQKCNNVLEMCKPESVEAGSKLAFYRGYALTYRAFAYFDMARMFEFRKCGVSKLDAEAETNGVWGLTVPIVTEKTTLMESYDNPRAEFWRMYRFILTDLDEAAGLLEGHTPSSKIYGDQTTVYGLLARLWLEMATRFENNPSDLNEALAHESETSYDKLGIETSKEAYAKAAEYAKLAQTGHVPVSELEWMSATNGFNTPVSSWMWCMSIGSDDDAVHSWMSWIPEMNPEVQYGVVYPLNAFRMIDAALFKGISDTDWRKLTWIAPSDANSESSYGKYQTNLTSDLWTKVPAYTGLKFRPAQGNIDDYTIGTAVSIPLMRVEEMMLIEAEARAFSEGTGAGVALLNTFMSYRDPSYVCSAGSTEELVDEIFRQKRIEFWGEGMMMFDYKRLCKQIKRKYSGSNFPSSHQINSSNGNGEVCRWLNFFITSSEYNYNKAVYDHRNPDPSGNTEYEY